MVVVAALEVRTVAMAVEVALAAATSPLLFKSNSCTFCLKGVLFIGSTKGNVSRLYVTILSKGCPANLHLLHQKTKKQLQMNRSLLSLYQSPHMQP